MKIYLALALSCTLLAAAAGAQTYTATGPVATPTTVRAAMAPHGQPIIVNSAGQADGTGNLHVYGTSPIGANVYGTQSITGGAAADTAAPAAVTCIPNKDPKTGKDSTTGKDAKTGAACLPAPPVAAVAKPLPAPAAPAPVTQAVRSDRSGLRSDKAMLHH